MSWKQFYFIFFFHELFGSPISEVILQAPDILAPLGHRESVGALPFCTGGLLLLQTEPPYSRSTGRGLSAGSAGRRSWITWPEGLHAASAPTADSPLELPGAFRGLHLLVLPCPFMNPLVSALSQAWSAGWARGAAALGLSCNSEWKRL